MLLSYPDKILCISNTLDKSVLDFIKHDIIFNIIFFLCPYDLRFYPESVKLTVFICQSTIRLAKSRKCSINPLERITPCVASAQSYDQLAGMLCHVACSIVRLNLRW